MWSNRPRHDSVHSYGCGQIDLGMSDSNNQYKVCYVSRLNWAMKLILCIWVGIQISSLVIEFCPQNSLCQSYCLMLLLSPEWHDLLARFFCRTVEHDVETNWIIFGLRWDLGFFVGVSLSQACFPFFALFLDSNGQMKLDWL